MVYVRKIDLPRRVHGVLVPHADGDYSVYINAGLSLEEQRLAWLHEKEHISGEHCYNDISSVAELEQAANSVPREKLTAFCTEEDAAVLFLRNQGAQPSHEQLSQIVKLLDTLPSEEDALSVT